MKEQLKALVAQVKAKCSSRQDIEYIFIAKYILHNWTEDFQSYAISKFIEIFGHISYWNFNSIRTHLELDEHAQQWIITSNRCQILYNISICLQEKITEYETRISRAASEVTTSLSESINQQITGRGPQKKLCSALFLKSTILDYALVYSQDTKVDFTIPEEYLEQFQDYGELFKIYQDLLLITNNQVKIIEPIAAIFGSESKKTSLTITPHQVTSFSDNHNYICYQYLKQIIDILTNREIRILCLNKNFANLGAYLSINVSVYSETTDYSLLYHLFIKNFNIACNNLSIISIDIPELKEDNKILNKISLRIYEHDFDLLNQIKIWQTDNINKIFAGVIETNLSKLKDQIKLITSERVIDEKEDTEILISFDPRYSESSLEKLRINFSDDSDPMACTNVPSKLSFIAANVLRLGCQTRTVSGNIEVYPSFIRYLHALRMQFIQQQKPIIASIEHAKLTEPTLLLYISNLRTDDSSTDIEATIEGQRNRALINLSEITPDFDIAIMPSNRSFLHPQQRTLNEPILILGDVINEISKIVLNNGQDFYLSARVRKKIFDNLSREQQYTLIREWINEAIHDLFMPDKIPFETSPATRQQIATHFFKYTLTNKLLEKLKPFRFTTPCKDNIDRGAVHTMYFSIIHLIKDLHQSLDNLENLTGSDKDKISLLNQKIKELLHYDLHCASLLVKGRLINSHNFGLLVHSLDRFMHGPYGYEHSPAFPHNLKIWIEQNSKQTLTATATSTISLADFESPTSDQDITEQMELIADDNIAAAKRAILKIPKDTRLPLIVSKSASLIGNTPYLLWYAAYTLRTAAMAASSSVASGVRSLYKTYSYQSAEDITVPANEKHSTHHQLGSN